MHPPLTAAQLALFAEAPKRRRKKPVPMPSSLLTVRCRCKSELAYVDPDEGYVWCPLCGRRKVKK